MSVKTKPLQHAKNQRISWIDVTYRFIQHKPRSAEAGNGLFGVTKALYTQNPRTMLWHTGIHIHFVVLMEPQSSGNCAFFVLTSGHKYNKIHRVSP